MRNISQFALALFIVCGSPTFAREWSDATGKFKVEAKLVSVKEGKVYLEKVDGAVVGVPLKLLSTRDASYLLGLDEYREYFKQNPLPIPPTLVPQQETQTITAPEGFQFGEIRRFPKMGWAVTSLAFSPNGGWLAVGKMDNILMLLDVEKARPLTVFNKLNQLGQVTCVCFTPDGKKLLAGGYSGRILVWSADSQGRLKPHSQFVGHGREISCIKVSADGKFVVSGGQDKSLRYWQLDNGKEIHAFEEFRGSVRACFMTPKGNQALGCDGESLILFDLKAGKSIEQMKLASYSTQDVDISLSGRRVILSDSYAVRMFDIVSGAEYPAMQKENEIQWTMTFSPNGKYVASGGRQKVNLWETKSGKRVHIIDLASSGYVKCIAFSPDNQHLAAISGNAGQDLQVFRLPKSDSLSE